MTFRRWLQISLASLLFVALLGTLMRYKIAFDFPFLKQKFLQHAHSHFAFAGWISQGLFLLVLKELDKRMDGIAKRYNPILSLNIFFSIGMCVAFILGGYWWLSIFFSTCVTIISLIFSIMFYSDSKLTQNVISEKKYILIDRWYYSALAFNALSIFGTIALSYLMVQKTGSQTQTLSAIYFYLHFQYNGWFLFALLGLLFSRFANSVSVKIQQLLFHVFLPTTVLNYLLSIMWLPMPVLLYSLVVISSVAQVIVWVLFSKEIKKYTFLDKNSMWFFRLMWFAFTLKLFLQVGSVIPFVSHLAYSLRSIVIAYLHLALLVLTSCYLLFELFAQIRNEIPRAFYWFYGFVIFNEILLAAQGISGVFYFLIPGLQQILFAVSVIMCVNLIWLLSAKENRRL